MNRQNGNKKPEREKRNSNGFGDCRICAKTMRGPDVYKTPAIGTDSEIQKRKENQPAHGVRVLSDRRNFRK